MNNNLPKSIERDFVNKSELSIYKENSSTFFDFEMARKCTIPIKETRMFSHLKAEYEKESTK